MPNSKRNMYICFSKEEIHLLEDFARNKGALNVSQALESLAKKVIMKIEFYWPTLKIIFENY